MFNPDYQVDVLKILTDARRHKEYSAIWPGEKKDGKLIANVEIDGTDETSCIMYLEFSVKSDTIQILACVRYDIS